MVRSNNQSHDQPDDEAKIDLLAHRSITSPTGVERVAVSAVGHGSVDRRRRPDDSRRVLACSGSARGERPVTPRAFIQQSDVPLLDELVRTHGGEVVAQQFLSKPAASSPPLVPAPYNEAAGQVNEDNIDGRPRSGTGERVEQRQVRVRVTGPSAMSKGWGAWGRSPEKLPGSRPRPLDQQVPLGRHLATPPLGPGPSEGLAVQRSHGRLVAPSARERHHCGER